MILDLKFKGTLFLMGSVQLGDFSAYHSAFLVPIPLFFAKILGIGQRHFLYTNWVETDIHWYSNLYQIPKILPKYKLLCERCLHIVHTHTHTNTIKHTHTHTHTPLSLSFSIYFKFSANGYWLLSSKVKERSGGIIVMWRKFGYQWVSVLTWPSLTRLDLTQIVLKCA